MWSKFGTTSGGYQWIRYNRIHSCYILISYAYKYKFTTDQCDDMKTSTKSIYNLQHIQHIHIHTDKHVHSLMIQKWNYFPIPTAAHNGSKSTLYTYNTQYEFKMLVKLLPFRRLSMYCSFHCKCGEQKIKTHNHHWSK